MKRIGTLIAVFAIFGFLLAPDSFAQLMWKGSEGWGPGSPYNSMYDLKTVVTVSGQVVSVDTIAPMKGMCYGARLMLKTDKETIPIHLGPGWFIERQDISIAPMDKIEVKGSRITLEGKPVILAAEVKKGDAILKLRDESGAPVWVCWKRLSPK